MMKKGKAAQLYKTPIKAIREKCLDCSCGQYKEVRLCPVINCALYPYRMGVRPSDDTLATLRSLSEKTDEEA